MFVDGESFLVEKGERVAYGKSAFLFFFLKKILISDFNNNYYSWH